MSLCTQKGVASPSTRLQPQLPSSSLGLSALLSSAIDVRGLCADVMTGLKELRQDMKKKIDRLEEKARKGREKLRDDLADAKS